MLIMHLWLVVVVLVQRRIFTLVTNWTLGVDGLNLTWSELFILLILLI